MRHILRPTNVVGCPMYRKIEAQELLDQLVANPGVWYRIIRLPEYGDIEPGGETPNGETERVIWSIRCLLPSERNLSRIETTTQTLYGTLLVRYMTADQDIAEFAQVSRA